MTRNIEFYIREMEGIISILAEDSSVQAFYGISGSSTGPYRDIAAGALRLMHNITEVNTEIAGVLLVNDRDEYLSNEIQPITRDPLTEESWYRQAVDAPGTVQLLPRPIGRNLRGSMPFPFSPYPESV